MKKIQHCFIIVLLSFVLTAWSHGSSPATFVNILDYLSPTQRAAVLAGANTTDITTEILAANAACTASGRCVLVFGPGYYYTTTCNIPITVPTQITGGGTANYAATKWLSIIACNSTNAPLFNVTADIALFTDIAMINTSGAEVSGSTAIFSNSAAYDLQRVDRENVYIKGFYDAVDVKVGWGWHDYNAMYVGFKNSGIHVRNTITPDAGGWRIVGAQLEGGQNSIGVWVESGGGGSIQNSNIQCDTALGILNAIYVNTGVTATEELQIDNNKLDCTNDIPVKIVSQWPRISITNNIIRVYSLVSTTARPAISCDGCTQLVISGNNMQGLGYGNAIELANCGEVSIQGPGQVLSQFGYSVRKTACAGSVYDGTPGNYLSTYDAVTTAWFARLTTIPTSVRGKLYNDAIVATTSAIWAKIDSFTVLAAADEATATKNIPNATYSPFATAGTPFTVDQGYGPGQTGVHYVDMGINPSTAGGHYTQTSAAIGIWNLSAGQFAGVAIGARGAPTVTSLWPRFTDNKFYLDLNSTADDPAGIAVATGAGLIAGTRSGTTLTYTANGSSLGTRTDTAAAIPNADITVLDGGGNPGMLISLALVGGTLSTTELTTIYNAWHPYMQAVAGAP